MNKIPDKYRDLLDRPIVVSLATLLSDGTPQVQPVWCTYDGHSKIAPQRVVTMETSMPQISAAS